MSVLHRSGAELLGTAFLLIAVVGSGIMGERLSGGNAAITLLANSLATGTALIALILTFSPVSGAHFNPAVTLSHALRGRMSWTRTPAYIGAQFAGALLGVAAAHLMFGEPIFRLSHRLRSGSSQMFSEFVATFGLLCVIEGCAKFRAGAVPLAAGLYIAGAYWFTSSTSFANPAATVARAFTDTFSGIRLADVPGFIFAQLAAAFSGVVVCRWLFASTSRKIAEPAPL